MGVVSGLEHKILSSSSSSSSSNEPLMIDTFTFPALDSGCGLPRFFQLITEAGNLEASTEKAVHDALMCVKALRAFVYDKTIFFKACALVFRIFEHHAGSVNSFPRTTQVAFIEVIGSVVDKFTKEFKWLQQEVLLILHRAGRHSLTGDTKSDGGTSDVHEHLSGDLLEQLLDAGLSSLSLVQQLSSLRFGLSSSFQAEFLSVALDKLAAIMVGPHCDAKLLWISSCMLGTVVDTSSNEIKTVCRAWQV